MYNREYPEYGVWKKMRMRCNNKRDPKYPRYGGRGIAICSAWDDFKIFLSDMGSRPGSEYSIDRIDNDGNYTPENCRWALPRTQRLNQKIHGSNKSGFRGVSQNKYGTWIAKITNKHLGCFKTKESAAIAYNNAAIILFGKEAKLNEVCYVQAF